MGYLKIIVGLLLCTACLAKKSNRSNQLNRLVKSNNDFSVNLFKELIGTQKKPNMVISSLSAYTVLIMVSDGADQNTRTQLLKELKLPQGDISIRDFKNFFQGSKKNKKVSFSLANKVCVTDNLDVKSSFTSLMEKKFLSSISLLSPNDPKESAKVVNDWVSRSTHKKITNIISEDDIKGKDAFMILLNAVYFKADWKYRFNKRLTEPQPWYYGNGTEKSLPMMHQRASFYTGRTESLQYIELPYKNEEFKMTVLVPNDEVSIKDVIKDLNPTLRKISKEKSERNLVLTMPKFKIETSESLVESLKKMGLTDMFGLEANFDRITSTGGLYVKDVRQKAFIEVNQQGSEAAAATAAIIMHRMAPPTFEINRPSVFLIMKKDAIVFMGYLTDPVY